MEECEFCGARFLPSRPWQRFDSRECQQAWNRRRYRQEQVERFSNGPSVQEVLKIAGVDVAPSNGSFVRRE
jgi:hypothetical protein